MKYNQIKHLKQFGSIITLSILISLQAFATSNIDTTDKYAWSENSGWLNFNGTNNDVTVYSDHLEGYVWAENIGLIRLGTHTSGGTHTYANDYHTNYGVNHDGSGNLSGYAWSENVGWIKFDDSNGGVTIDTTTLDFDGYAWAENVGWIHFKNTSPAYKVKINKADQTITFNPPATKTYGDAAFDLTATGGDSGNPVTFSSSTTSVCTLSGSTVTILTAGTCTIAADQAGNTNYNAAPQVSQNITINKADTTTTINSDNADPSVIDQSITVDVTVSSTTSATPTGTVTVDDGNNNTCEVTLNNGSGSCVLTPANGNTTLTATYNDNNNFNGSSDTEQHASLTAGIQIDDGDGVNIAESGTTDTYTLAATTVPANAITLTITANAQTEISTDGINFAETANLTITDLTTHTITIKAIDDTDIEGNHTAQISHAITAGDNTDYPTNLNIRNVEANIIDNEPAVIITISDSNTQVTEDGATDTFEVMLNTQPTNDVTISLSPDSPISVDLNTLTFTNANWNTAQTVTVSVIDNSTVEYSYTRMINLSASSEDSNYDEAAIFLVDNTVATSLSVNITDNDLPLVELSVNANSGTETDSTEITVTATASSAVSGDQSLNLAVTGVNDSDYSLSGTVINIADGQTTGTVTFTIVDDNEIEGTETATLTISNPTTGIILGTTTTQDIEIINNDFPPSSPSQQTPEEPTETGCTLSSNLNCAIKNEGTITNAKIEPEGSIEGGTIEG